MKTSAAILPIQNRQPDSAMNSNAPSRLASRVPSRRSLRHSAFLIPTLLLALAPAGRAADANPPDRLTYQGFLVDVTGTALGATAPKNYDVVFRIYDAQSSGHRLWTEQQTATVDKGYFSVLLGEGTQVGSESHPALATLFADASASDRYVETTVKGIAPGGLDSTLLPRLRLLTVPYAFLAKHSVSASSLVNASNTPVITLAGMNVDMAGTLVVPTVNATTVNATTANATTVNAASVVKTPTVEATTLNATTLNVTTVSATHTVNATTVNGYGTIPIGGIIMWSGSVPPTGWAVCNGQTAYGTLTPDLRNRFIVGSDWNYTRNTTGGASAITLNANQLPAHSHDYKDGFHSEAYAPNLFPFNFSYDYLETPVSGSHGTDDDNKYIYYRNLTTAENSVAYRAAVEILPPYYAMAFIMRVQ
jgi:hypothetical protein